MKECPRCNYSNINTNETCSQCGASLLEVAEGHRTRKDPHITLSRSYNYLKKYETAHTLGQVVSFVGWFVLTICGLILLIGFITSLERGGSFLRVFLSLSVAMGGAISGLFLVLTGQITQAVVDGVNNTGEMLAILKSQFNEKKYSSYEHYEPKSNHSRESNNKPKERIKDNSSNADLSLKQRTQIDPAEKYAMIKNEIIDELKASSLSKEEVQILDSLSRLSLKEINKMEESPEGFTETGLKIFKLYCEKMRSKI